MHAGMGLQRVKAPAHRGAVMGSHQAVQTLEPSKDGWSVPSPLHCLTILQGIVPGTEKGAVLNWYCASGAAAICFSGEYQPHETKNSQRSSGLFSEQR